MKKRKNKKKLTVFVFRFGFLLDDSKPDFVTHYILKLILYNLRSSLLWYIETLLQKKQVKMKIIIINYLENISKSLIRNDAF